MDRLRLLGVLGALVVALGGVGSLAAFGLRVGATEFRVASTAAVFALLVVLSLAVVVLGSVGARTRETTYW